MLKNYPNTFDELLSSKLAENWLWNAFLLTFFFFKEIIHNIMFCNPEKKKRFQHALTLFDEF